MSQAWHFLGQPVSREALDRITAIVGEYAGLSRDELAATVCELLGWTRATGRVKTRECRDLLERLESAGSITLPAKRGGRPLGARTAVPVTGRGDARPAVIGTVRDLRPLEIVRVTTAADRLLFRELVGRHHYLGHAVPFGAHVRVYLEGQRERVGYRELRRRGLPRGSGGVESANKLICHVRLKRSGAWWLEANGNAMLRIRCGTFERIFIDYMAKHRAKKPSP